MSVAPRYLLLKADAKRLPLADRSVHMVCTSPPYFALRSYLDPADPLKSLEMGQEPTPAGFVAGMVAAFREVRRVLRDDGVLWLNIGDSYANWVGPSRTRGHFGKHEGSVGTKVPKGFKEKDLIGIPWRLAIALQDDGWYLRSDTIWRKLGPMPESVTDRPTRAHEYVFLLTKGPRYFYDTYAVRSPQATAGRKHDGRSGYREGHPSKGGIQARALNPLGAAASSVWSIASGGGYRGAHFATMPLALASRCVKLGTSAKGCCPACGSPWRRVVEKARHATRPGSDTKVEGSGGSAVVGNRDPLRHVAVARLVGWESSCTCREPVPVPCRVFDPFNGAATTGVAATGLGRDYIGCDLSDDYLGQSRARIERPHRSARPVAVADEAMPLFGAQA